MDTISEEPEGSVRRTRRRRRTYSKALKREMVAATLDGGESVSLVARRYDVNANQLFRWRSQYRQGLLADDVDTPVLLPISVDVPLESHRSAVPAGQIGAGSADTGYLEITFPRGQRLVIKGTVCPQALRTVLETLSR